MKTAVKQGKSKNIITIDVLATHIKKGKVADPQACPVALAMKAAGMKKVSVRTEYADAIWQGKDYYISLPAKVVKFIERFDGHTDTLKPFSFRVNLNE